MSTLLIFLAISFSVAFIVSSIHTPLSASIIAGLALFSAQYNYTTISFAVLLMEEVYGSSPVWASSSMVSSVFAGSIFGMFLLGFAGDMMGRKKAMTLTLGIAALGAILSAYASWGDTDAIYALITVWRFILGIGVGGIYPLSSASSYESETKDKKKFLTAEEKDMLAKQQSLGMITGVEGLDQKALMSPVDDLVDESHVDLSLSGHRGGKESVAKGASKTASVFFWQIPGQITVYLVGLLLLATNWSYEVDWRLLLFSGSLPVLFAMPSTSSLQAMVFRLEGLSVPGGDHTEEEAIVEEGSGSAADESSHFASTMKNLSKVLSDEKHSMPLLGACLAWFLFDIYVYGVSAFSPTILDMIFTSDSLSSNCWQNIFSNLVTIPAAATAIVALRYVNARDLQIAGFAFVILAFVLFAALWSYLEDSSAWLFALFCFLKFAMATFVPATTYAMPNILFPQEIRATCNGVAAASGKLGAFIGTFLFPIVYEDFGMTVLLICCAVVALLGIVVTALLIPAIEDADHINIMANNGTGSADDGPNTIPGEGDEHTPLLGSNTDPKSTRQEIVI